MHVDYTLSQYFPLDELLKITYLDESNTKFSKSLIVLYFSMNFNQ